MLEHRAERLVASLCARVLQARVRRLKVRDHGGQISGEHECGGAESRSRQRVHEDIGRGAGRDCGEAMWGASSSSSFRCLRDSARPTPGSNCATRLAIVASTGRPPRSLAEAFRAAAMSTACNCGGGSSSSQGTP